MVLCHSFTIYVPKSLTKSFSLSERDMTSLIGAIKLSISSIRLPRSKYFTERNCNRGIDCQRYSVTRIRFKVPVHFNF